MAVSQEAWALLARDDAATGATWLTGGAHLHALHTPVALAPATPLKRAPRFS